MALCHFCKRADFANGAFMTFIVGQFLVMVVGAQAYSTLAIDLRSRGVHTSTFGWLMAINGIMIVLLQPTAIGIVTKLHRGRVLAVAALLQGIGFGMYAPGSSLPWYIAAVVVWTFAELGYSPVAPAVVSDLAPARLRGTYQGVYSMAWGASSCVAPAIGSVVLGHLGSTALWTGCFGVCLVAVWLHLTRGSAYTRHVSAQTRAE